MPHDRIEDSLRQLVRCGPASSIDLVATAEHEVAHLVMGRRGQLSTDISEPFSSCGAVRFDVVQDPGPRQSR